MEMYVCKKDKEKLGFRESDEDVIFHMSHEDVVEIEKFIRYNYKTGNYESETHTDGIYVYPIWSLMKLSKKYLDWVRSGRVSII